MRIGHEDSTPWTGVKVDVEGQCKMRELYTQVRTAASYKY